MQIPYDPKKIEPKWQKKWQDEKLYEADDVSPSPKFYSLIEFPYPSGAGLHTGHIRSNTAMDIISRKRRMEGWNVLYPIGWDAFGLPTENFAIKTGKDPAVVTKENTDNFRRQLQSLGFSFDWSREINTTDPAYYKWTQWIFLQMYKKGLAYKAKMTINWCPKDKIGLANEEVIDGKCERCGTQVEKREKEQWMLAITKYADRLDKDLDTVDFQERIKIQQRNWIGRSEGAEIEFPISNFQFPNNEKTKVKVFTTRPDTLFGATYLVLAPEYPFIENLKFKIKNWSEVELYIKQAKQKSEIDRTAETKDKTGVRLDGVTAVNPVTNEEIPMFVADYVLAHYGTGAIMAVPAHDARDFEFAKKFGLPIQEVVMERLVDAKNPHVPGKEIVFRDAVIAAVRDPKTGKFLILKWKKQPWTTFVMGGIEKGEDAATAAAREILEETGYKNVKVVKTLREAQSEFYAAHKGVNRVAHTRNLILELVNDEREKISDEESEIHEIAWMSLDEIRNAGMTHSEMPIFYEGFESIEIPFTGRGILTNSGKFDGMSSEDAAKAIVEAVGGKIVTTYKLRDWVFSRQRYWGEPIPLIHCDNCGWQPVPEEDLPVRLPKVEKYEPTDDGESPLSKISEWVNVKCPNCGGDAKRETDTMPQWAGSSWYYLRYADPHNAEAFADASKLKKWLPVDWYNGGMEHTTLHLLYSRFWHKFLFDQGL
ncbi:MAG TPA: class I tRNA ligase family protein, partial [Candidatus Paceibacterota bacterium]|nr:class I tRNA ligase family protein [Candidatus Paceibacterota bacterium]